MLLCQPLCYYAMIIMRGARMAGHKNFDPLMALKPGQMNRTKVHIKEYAKHYCEDMINILCDIAHDEGNYARDRIAAAEAILNRGYGRPVDANKADNEIGEVINVEKLSSAQLMSIITQYDNAEVIEEAPATPLAIAQEIVVAANELIERDSNEEKI